MIAVAAAPAIVKAENIMRIKPVAGMKRTGNGILVPEWLMDGDYRMSMASPDDIFSGKTEIVIDYYGAKQHLYKSLVRF
jgi:hypothetical protein